MGLNSLKVVLGWWKCWHNKTFVSRIWLGACVKGRHCQDVMINKEGSLKYARTTIQNGSVFVVQIWWSALLLFCSDACCCFISCSCWAREVLSKQLSHSKGRHSLLYPPFIFFEVLESRCAYWSSIRLEKLVDLEENARFVSEVWKLRVLREEFIKKKKKKYLRHDQLRYD